MVNKPEVQETTIHTLLTPEEASRQYQEIFDDFQAKFRNFHKNMTSAIEDIQSKTAEVAESLKVNNQLKASAISIEKTAEDKLKEATQKLESANSKMLLAQEEEKRLSEQKVKQDKTDAALGKQREEITSTQQELKNRTDDLDMLQRAVDAQRIKVERFQRDLENQKVISGAK